MISNVKPSQLNYDRYTQSKYDRDIINVIPYHKDIHKHIEKIIKTRFSKKGQIKILDLGVGTGLTSQLIQKLLPQAQLEVVDFSKTMLAHAKKKLGKHRVKFLSGDYATIHFEKQYDIIISVIGLHHQNHKGKQRMFKKIYRMLNPGGLFIFGDLITYRDKKKAAYNQALHFNHLTTHATDTKTLTEWAYHHIFLNDLAPVEDQIQWLRKVGFIVKLKFLKMNTALIECTKL